MKNRIGVPVIVLVLLAAFASQALARGQAASSVTATAKGQKLGETTWVVTVSGKVASPNPACRANRAVTVEFLFPTPPNIKTKAKSAANGSYTGSSRLNPSADESATATGIKVTVAKSTANGVTCKEATKTIPVPSP
jgi:hypothetical protein